MKFTLIAASSLLKHSTQKQVVETTNGAHERALLLLKERVMVLKEPLENMMQSLPALPSLSLPPQLQSLQFQDCQESFVRLFQEPMHSTTALAVNVLLVILLVIWAVAARRRQDKSFVRSPSFSLEKESNKKKEDERESRWKALLQKRPVTKNGEAMSAWLLEVLAVSDLQAPLASSSLNKPKMPMPMVTKQVSMPFINTWNINSTVVNEEKDDEEWTEQDPAAETSC